ncbi:MAG TPA: hypothetical protein VMZ31_00265 [Phycisphaerae bacterium]|nr:hypothetical protein [Phycisphaerae bacterium]
MLMNMLSSHPSIHCNSDLLTKDVRERGEEWAYAEGFRLPPKYPERSPLPQGKRPERVGFLIKMKQDLHQTIRKRSGLKVLLLHRRNRLATLLSRNVSHRLGPYVEIDMGACLDEAIRSRGELPALHIDSGEAEAFFEEWSAKTDEVICCLAGTDWLHVFYEDLCRDPQTGMRPVYEHLGVPFHLVQSTPGWGAKKLDPRRLCEAIENYEELKAYFAGTRWEGFFADQP